MISVILQGDEESLFDSLIEGENHNNERSSGTAAQDERKNLRAQETKMGLNMDHMGP